MSAMRTLTIDGMEVVLRPARWQELLDLRHAVLRQGLPREEAFFSGDDAPTTRHYGGFVGDVAAVCATMLASEWEREQAWQLRGMATLPEYRGKGLGRAILAELEAGFDSGGVAGAGTLLWCNARVPAVGFYQAMGWQVVSGQFDIPTAGPHMKMIKRLVR